MAKNIIEVRSLSKNFYLGSTIVRALREVSFSIKEGEFVSIMGTSGSGKSTMLNILGCLDYPTAGDYMLDEIHMSGADTSKRAELRNAKIGFVFQSFNLLPRTTALENVELPLFYNPTIQAKDRRTITIRALEQVKLADRMHHTPSQLSGGQQQRVAIARALVNNPVVIFADEATGNLDTRTSYEIMALFQELNEQGKTIVFVTHEPDIANFTKRSIVFRDGIIIQDTYNSAIQNAKAKLAALPIDQDYNT